ncbi:hypothetical protein C0991_001277, partial [Blastosporella zonata]
MRLANPFSPPPAPPAFGAGKVIPEAKASLFSKLIFHWLVPFLDVGFSRPLEKDGTLFILPGIAVPQPQLIERQDLWDLPPHQLTSATTDALEANFYARCEPEKRPRSIQPGVTIFESKQPVDEKASASKPASKSKKPKYDSSLFYALHTTFFVRIWVGGFLKLGSDTLKTTTPLVTKVLLAWLTNSYIYHRLSDEEKASGSIDKPQGIGYGIGLAIALFAMQEIASLRVKRLDSLFEPGFLIGTVFRKSLRSSGRARLEHSAGQITTMISTDASRLDRFTAFAPILWVSPIQIAIGIGLLIGNLGYSALVGLGVLLLGLPIQFILVKVMFTQRKKCVQFTDKRIRLTTEVLQGIRLIKFYAWESFYIDRLGRVRALEIKAIRKTWLARAILISVVTFIPILATILSFITYALSGHDLTVAVVFSSLQLFNIIREPLTYFPFVLSHLSDALVALGRISKFLTSEELADPYLIDYEQKTAVSVDGDFTWETAGKLEENKFAVGGKAGKGKPRKKADTAKPKKEEFVLPTTANLDSSATSTAEGSQEDEKPFELKDLKFTVPKGSFVAIVGRVGSGKSSVLQALIGEMRKTRGEILFGGNVAYVPQTPWIRNATLRDNVLFGEEDSEKRFREIIRACNLEHDLEMLPHGEHTEIGEKGINLSGGQKARVSLARAAYSQSDVVLLDDPLSAVDAYVGRAILDQCLLNGPLANRTRILVTHSLHVLDKTDYIYVMDNGTFTEQGTYESLMGNSIVFSRLMDEYGNLEQDSKDGDVKKAVKAVALGDSDSDQDGKKSDGALMQAEERNTGSVTWKVYGDYLWFAGGVIWAPILILLITLAQGAQGQPNILISFVVEGIASLIASLNLFKAALTHVLRSPVSLFDTTPIVLVDVQLCPWNGGIGFLHIPLPRDHVRADDRAVLDRVNLLQAYIRRNETAGLLNEINALWRLF